MACLVCASVKERLVLWLMNSVGHEVVVLLMEKMKMMKMMRDLPQVL